MAKTQDLNWDNLRYVLAVSRNISFSKAAHSLGVNESTVARRISQTERQFNAPLFVRKNNKILLTEMGMELVKFAEAMETEALRAQTQIAGATADISGLVRITTVPNFVNHILIPALPLLQDQHPNLTIELVADPENLSISGLETDLALRLARPRNDLKAITRKIGNLDYAVYGSIQKTSEQLPWIKYSDGMRGHLHADWVAAQNSKDHQATPNLVANDGEAIFQCIKAGLGKSLLPALIGDQHSQITKLPSPNKCPTRELWLMSHPERKNLPRIKAVSAWLCSLFNP